MVDQQVLKQQIPKTNKDSGTVTGDWQGSVLDVPSLVAPAEAGAGGFSQGSVLTASGVQKSCKRVSWLAGVLW